VLGISVDSVHSHRAFARELGGIDFPLLADFHPKGDVIKHWPAVKKAEAHPDEVLAFLKAR